jgi:aminoglycoside phosphotransferase (APT) family kinase protein
MNEPLSFFEILRRTGHVVDPDARFTPLSGGVSSEIYLVEDGSNKFVVKRALPRLKVNDAWFADVSRNRAERDYLAYVHGILPGAVPELCFSSPDDGYFGMEYLGEDFSNWKHLLLGGDFRIRHAELAGHLLGEIHRRTGGKDELRRQFDTTANFHQLRVEPYLLTTGARHPLLQGLFDAEARRIEATRAALVHGDFSPKNILISGDRMVLLDCEVAWYGDPAFDVAYLLNHLLLKSLYHAPQGEELSRLAKAFWQTYRQQISTADFLLPEKRIVPLLLMLLLARVDGKSPVEYLSLQKKEFIRAFVYKHLPAPPDCLAALFVRWFAEIFAAEFPEIADEDRIHSSLADL